MTLTIAKQSFQNRVFLGTAGYPNLACLEQALLKSETEMVTVAIRRISLHTDQPNDLLGLLKQLKLKLLPNTAGCYTTKEAILTAHLAREALHTNWVKLEVLGDRYSLYPDHEALLAAAKQLVTDGFTVLPYCGDDPVVCQKLADLGCAAIMPLGAPIGSGQGIRNPHNLALIRKQIKLPLILDAGIGTASHATQAMELGFDGVLLNTAVAKAKDPVKMALAMKHGTIAGRLAYESGRIPEQHMATPSTPDRGRILN